MRNSTKQNGFLLLTSFSPSQLPLFTFFFFASLLSLSLFCRGSDFVAVGVCVCERAQVCVSKTTNRKTCSFSPLMSRRAAVNLQTVDPFKQSVSM